VSTVFVTGGSGFIGGRLIERLTAHGHAIRGLARSEQAAARIGERGGEPVRGDAVRGSGLRTRVSRGGDAR
jgi:nucleoside-diphosphate-sugar epimerase